MLRLFIALNLLVLNLLACKGENYSCIQKIIDSNTIENQKLQIPITQHQRIIFSEQIPHAKILKSDPFLNLYLVEDTKGFRYPFSFNKKQKSRIACVNTHTSKVGMILQEQVGLNSFAVFKNSLAAPALLTSSCCFLEGIVTPRGVIEKEYIQRFFLAKETAYSDIGVRVKKQNGFVTVIAADPFIMGNPFKIGDCILSFDGKKVISSSVFMKNVLFSKLGSSHKLKVKRNSQVFILDVTTQKRYGGGYISDTFLEHFGMYFTQDLTLSKLEKGKKSYGLKIGDKLIQVNGERVKNQQEVMTNISSSQNCFSLLFERDGFQFFVNVN